MKVRIAEENQQAVTLLPPAQPDGSGIGVNYADAYIKPIAAELDDGRKIACKRKGLEISLTVGDAKGTALLRRLEHGPDARAILRRALEDAAAAAGAKLTVEDGSIWLELPDPA